MKSSNKLIALGSLMALAGFLLSGPLAFLFVQLIKPQPAWTSASIFTANYSPVQNLPYFFGFVLIGGLLILAAAHYLDAANNHLTRLRLLLSLSCTLIFSVLIGFNYICQTSFFVHHLAEHYKPEYDAAIATFSMANPMSLCWAIEMWGYAVLGIATWLMAAYYRGKNNAIRILLTANGLVSVGSVVFMVVDNQWLMTSTGLVAYGVWNILMIVLLGLIYRHAKQQQKRVSSQNKIYEA